VMDDHRGAANLCPAVSLRRAKVLQYRYPLGLTIARCVLIGEAYGV
jgi:hypothetical protein